MQKDNNTSVSRLQEKPLTLTSKNIKEVAELMKTSSEKLLQKVCDAISNPYHQRVYLIFVKDTKLRIKPQNFAKILNDYKGSLPKTGAEKNIKLGNNLELNRIEKLNEYLNQVADVLEGVKSKSTASVGIKIACQLVNEYGDDAQQALEMLQEWAKTKYSKASYEKRIKIIYKILYLMRSSPQHLDVYNLEIYEDELVKALKQKQVFG